MNKGELIEVISNECDISKALAKRMLAVFEKHTTNTLKMGEKVELLNFFTLTPFKTKKRKVFVPPNGRFMTVKSQHRVKFRMGKGFKEALN